MRAMPDAAEEGGTIDFAARKITSPEFFLPLFREGMDIVAAAAAYLDGDGKRESEGLGTGRRLAYIAVSIHLVMVLTEIAAWLFLHRGVQEGEITMASAASDPGRPSISGLGRLADLPGRDAVPERLDELADRIDRLRIRLAATERALYGEQTAAFPNPVLQRIALIEAAFSRS